MIHEHSLRLTPYWERQWFTESNPGMVGDDLLRRFVAPLRPPLNAWGVTKYVGLCPILFEGVLLAHDFGTLLWWFERMEEEFR